MIEKYAHKFYADKNETRNETTPHQMMITQNGSNSAKSKLFVAKNKMCM